jgi:hypothetical protein
MGQACGTRGLQIRYKGLARKPEECLLAGPSCRWDKFKLETGFRLNYLANDRTLWWALANTVLFKVQRRQEIS